MKNTNRNYIFLSTTLKKLYFLFHASFSLTFERFTPAYLERKKKHGPSAPPLINMGRGCPEKKKLRPIPQSRGHCYSNKQIIKPPGSVYVKP